MPRAIVPKKSAPRRCNFRHSRRLPDTWRNPLKRPASAFVEPGKRVKSEPRFAFPDSATPRSRFKMTLTVAHISPIMSVVAGLLILIMPRLLNLVVAVFLLLNGLIGLGLLKWLHL
jgi:antibiotic biosynthesis monooxygenase (ABM) superfamily enzyme